MFGCPVDFDAVNRKAEQDMADGTTARKDAARRKETEKMLGGNPFAFNKEKRSAFCDIDWKKMGASAKEIRKTKRECKDGDSEIDSLFNEMRAVDQLQ